MVSNYRWLSYREFRAWLGCLRNKETTFLVRSGEWAGRRNSTLCLFNRDAIGLSAPWRGWFACKESDCWDSLFDVVYPPTHVDCTGGEFCFFSLFLDFIWFIFFNPFHLSLLCLCRRFSSSHCRNMRPSPSPLPFNHSCDSDFCCSESTTPALG